MTQLVKIKLDDTEVWIEADESVAEKTPRLVSAEEAAEKALETAQNLHATIRAYCASLVQGFQALSPEQKPRKITAEFGLKLSGDSKFYVVNVAGEASLKITAQWEIE